MKTRPHCRYRTDAVFTELRKWYASTVGQQLLEELQTHLDDVLVQLFGYYAIQIGNIAPSYDLLDSCRVRYNLRMDSVQGRGDVQAELTDLPFQSDSVDLVVLMHGMGFSSEPHQILREVDRILIPEGHMILVEFSPLGFYGLWKSLRFWQNTVPWCGRFYTHARLKDWLSLLGFQELRCDHLGQRPPIQHAGIQQRLAFMENQRVQRWLPGAGGLQVILAQKKVARLTPIKPQWQPRAGLVTGNLTEPSTRGMPSL